MAKNTAAPTSGRVPLMAGNWKMNLDHLQATHLVQKLDWTLRDAKHDYTAVEVAVLPPFTDLRSVQTLVEGDKLELRYGAQDLSPHTSGAYTHGLTPILCCGEALDVRREGRQVEHVLDQLRADLDGVTKEQAASVVI